VSLVDEFADFVGSVPFRETRLPWGTAQVWDMGEGRPVVMLHGIAGGRRPFFRLAPRVAGARRVVVPPLRGEDMPAGDVELDTLLDDLAVLLAELDLRDVTLFGFSFGGYLALAYGARKDPRVRDIVVQGTFTHFRLRLLDRVILGVSRLFPDSLCSRYFVHRVRHGQEYELWKLFTPGLEELVADWSGKTPFATLRRRTHMITQCPVQALARKIDVPLTLAHGRKDKVVPITVFERLRTLLPGARAVAWDDVGHQAALTHPDEVAALLVP